VSIDTVLPQKVNPTDKLSLSASISSSEDIDVWSTWGLSSTSEILAFSSGILDEVAITSLTMISTFSSSSTDSWAHNLVIPAGELIAGATYTFSVAGVYSGQSTAAVSQVSVVVNSAPTSGTLVITPEEGYAITDAFELRASNWVDEDLPLEYSFTYYTSAGSSSILAVQGSSNVIEDVMLPQGTGTSYELVCGLNVYDWYGAYGTESSTVSVYPYSGTAAELAIVSSEVMADAIASYDTNTLNNAVASAASVLDATNCSLAPNCTELNREPCGDNGDHTCGNCKENYYGSAYVFNQSCVVLSNSCINEEWDSSNETDVDCGGGCQPCTTGLACVLDEDCEYNLCSDGICSVGSKSCESNCNQNGVCMYASVNGEALSAEECLLNDPYCTTTCNCTTGFYGDACGYTNSTWWERQALRVLMVDQMVTAQAFTDVDEDSVSQSSSTLNTLLAGAEELSAEGLVSALGFATSLASGASGLSSSGSVDTLAGCLDSLMGTDLLTANSNASSMLSSSVNSLTSALSADLVAGEEAATATTDSLQMSAGVYSVASADSLEINIPQSNAQQSSGVSQTSVSFGSDAVSTLSSLGDLTIGLTQFTDNIYSDSNVSTTQSGVVRLSLQSTGSASGSFEATISLQNYADISYSNLNFSSIQKECSEGDYSREVFNCYGKEIIINCTGESEMVSLNCTSPFSQPRCILWMGDYWDDTSCTVGFFNSSTTVCHCIFDLNTRRRLSDGEDESFASGDISSDLDAIGNQLSANFAGFSDPFTDPSVILQNPVVFITMACIVMGVPLIAWGTSQSGRYLKKRKLRLEKKFRHMLQHDKKGNQRKGSIGRRISITKQWHSVMPNVTQTTIMYQKFKTSFVEQHPWAKAFHIKKPAWTKHQAVSIALTYCLTLMFWDATLYPLVHPITDGCDDLTGENDCLDLGCDWDSDSSSCSTAELDSSFESTIFIVIYSLFLTLPICLALNKIILKSIGVKPGEENRVNWQVENVAEASWQVPTEAGTQNYGNMVQRLHDWENIVTVSGSPRRSPKSAEFFQSLFSGSRGSSPRGRNSSEPPPRSRTPIWPFSQHKSTSGTPAQKSPRSISPDVRFDGLKMADVVRDLRSKQQVEKDALRLKLLKVRMEEEMEFCKGQGLLEKGNKKQQLKKIRKEVQKCIQYEEEMEFMDHTGKEEYLTEKAFKDAYPQVQKIAMKKVDVSEEKEMDIWDDDPHQRIARPLLTPLQKQYLGLFFVAGYSIFCAYYVCLFGIRFGSTYTNAWLKTFFLGFIQSLVVTRPVKIAVIFFLCLRIIPTKLDLDLIKNLPPYSAVAQIARKYPNFEISKILLDKEFYPPGYLELKEEQEEQEHKCIKCNAERVAFGFAMVLATALLVLPDDLQDLILEGGIVVGFNYILLGCGAGKIDSDYILYLTVFGVIPLISLLLYGFYKLYQKVKQSEAFNQFTENLEM